MPAMEFEERKWRDREALRQIIGQWNANRLDLFSLSEPNDVRSFLLLYFEHLLLTSFILSFIRILSSTG